MILSGLIQRVEDAIVAGWRSIAGAATPQQALAVVQSAEELGITAWKAATLKASEHMATIKALVQGGTCQSCNIEAALVEIVNFSTVALELYREATKPAQQAPPSESESGHEVSDK